MKRLPLAERPVVVVDVETTGLDETFQEIIEYAAIRLDGTVIFHTKIKPTHLDEAMEKDPEGTKKALKINGYNEDDWKDAPTWEDIAPKVLESLTGVVILGQNVSFDMRFINRWLKATIGNEGIGYHTVDTATMAYEHLVPCGLRSVSLGAVCEFLNIGNEGAHTALADTRRTLAVYHKLNRASWIRRLWWRIVGPRRAKAARKAARKART